MKIITIILLGTLMKVDCNRPDRDHLEEIFSWEQPDFEIPPNRREQAISSGSYIPNRNGIYSLGIWQRTMFAGIFRFQTGVASSLNSFSLDTIEKSPVLIPYPSFEANYVNEDPNNRTVSLPSPSSVISALYFAIDKCDRLWVPDSGFSDYFGNRRSIAQQAIVIFNLTNNTLERRIEIPARFLNPLSTISHIVIDIGDNCEDVHAYVADSFRSIIVYSFRNDRIWQVEHNFMGSDPHEGHFVYQNLHFDWNFGIYAMGLVDQQSDGSKRVYFAAVASTSIFYVSNRVLQDANYTLSKYYYDFHLLGNVGKDGHTKSMIYDPKTGALFSTMFGIATVSCWNTRLPFKSMHTVHKKSNNFYPTDVDIDANDNLWVVSSLVPITAYGELQSGQTNMGIFKKTVAQAIADTHCKI